MSPLSTPEPRDTSPVGLAARAAAELTSGDYTAAGALALVSIAGALATGAVGELLLTPEPQGTPLDPEAATAMVRALVGGQILEAIETWPNRAWLGVGSLDLAPELAEHIAREWCTADAR